MPIDYTQYHPDWHTISWRIRFDRAGGRCECRGQCGLDHHAEAIEHDADIHRESGGLLNLRPEWDWERCLSFNGELHIVTGSKIVLTVCHLDHDIANNEEGNLLAMCPRCHLRYDAAHHARNAANTRRRRQVEAGQLRLFDL
jgi:hypothetical protein